MFKFFSNTFGSRIHGNNLFSNKSYKTYIWSDPRYLTYVSAYDPRTDNLIHAIQNKKYDNAYNLVNEGVYVDDHNKTKNTPLIDAAKRGDIKDILFLVKKLNADLHASYFYSNHKTALHYASQYNHRDAVIALLHLGSNPAIRDVKNKKAIDLTKDNNIKNILQLHENKIKKRLDSMREI